MAASDGSLESGVDDLPLARIFSSTIETLARRKLAGEILSDADVITICGAIVEDINVGRAALRRLIDSLSPP